MQLWRARSFWSRNYMIYYITDGFYVERTCQNLIKVYCIRNDTINWCTCDLTLYATFDRIIFIASIHRYIKKENEKKDYEVFKFYHQKKCRITTFLFFCSTLYNKIETWSNALRVILVGMWKMFRNIYLHMYCSGFMYLKKEKRRNLCVIEMMRFQDYFLGK